MQISKLVNTAGITLRNALLGFNVISLAQLKNPRKMVNYISESLFIYKGLTSQRGIPQKNVFDVLPTNSSEQIKLAIPKNGDENWFGPKASFSADLVSLCLICQAIKPKTIFEIGTYTGYTAYHFAMNTLKDTKIFTLDLPKNGTIKTRLNTTLVDDQIIKTRTQSGNYLFNNTNVSNKITCLFDDSASFDFEPFYNTIDFFFIDGAHSYEYVRSDTLNALKCCHPGSIIAWHDFGRVGVNGVSKCVLEFSKSHNIYSIPGGSLAFMVVE